MHVEYRCPKCGTEGHKEMYKIGEGENDGLYTCITCWREWAESYKRKRMEEDGRGEKGGEKMKIKRIERGLKLLTFACELCDKEVDVADIWTVEGEEYRIYICSSCLVKEVERDS